MEAGIEINFLGLPMLSRDRSSHDRQQHYGRIRQISSAGKKKPTLRT